MKALPLVAILSAVTFSFASCTATQAQVFLRSATVQGDSLESLPTMISSLGIGGGRQLPNDTARLLRLPQIKEELGLGDDQVEAIGKLSQAMRQQMSEVFRNVDFASGDANQIMQEAQKSIRIKTEEKLEELLTPPQLARLKQIKVQSAFHSKGATAILGGELSDQIRLSDKQKDKLKKLHAKNNAEMEREIAALRERYRKETLAEVLTESQLSDLEKLSGEPYEVKKPDMRSLFGMPPRARPTAEKKD